MHKFGIEIFKMMKGKLLIYKKARNILSNAALHLVWRALQIRLRGSTFSKMERNIELSSRFIFPLHFNLGCSWLRACVRA
jgi:hypothetical protein